MQMLADKKRSFWQQIVKTLHIHDFLQQVYSLLRILNQWAEVTSVYYCNLALIQLFHILKKLQPTQPRQEDLTNTVLNPGVSSCPRRIMRTRTATFSHPNHWEPPKGEFLSFQYVILICHGCLSLPGMFYSFFLNIGCSDRVSKHFDVAAQQK